MKKIILILAFIAQFAYSQDIENCKFDYQIEVSKNPEKQVYNDIKLDMKWDFTKIKSKNSEITIQIVPIGDCDNELNASLLNKEILITSKNNDSFKLKNDIVLSHIEMKAKCFKYRVIVKSKCEEISEWKFYSFLN